MDTSLNEATRNVTPSTREVLNDLTSERGLVNWRLHSVSGRDIIVGSAVAERLQDNRLQRKRKHRGVGVTTPSGGDDDTGSVPTVLRASFVVVGTALEPMLSMDSLLDLHATASRAEADIERVYLCLTDAGNISYYRLTDGFAPSSSSSSTTGAC